MTEDDFWSIVHASGGGYQGDCEAQADRVRQRLAGLTTAEIASFKARFQEQMNRAYSWELWGAAFIINAGCSDDGFEYFRAWLIMQGRNVFEAALADPETLVDVVDAGEVECEEILYVPFEVYEKVSGGQKLQAGPWSPAEPTGKAWTEEDLETRFPRLTEMFG
jgi:uncharacterized protein DUF4240